MVVVTIEGIDAYKAEERLRSLGFIDDNKDEHFVLFASNGNCRKVDRFKPILKKGKTKAFIADPGELCVKIETDDIDALIEICYCLGVPATSKLVSMIMGQQLKDIF